MNIFAVSGIALLSCAAAVILRRFGEAGAYLIPAAAAICLTSAAVVSAAPAADFIKSLDPGGEFTSYYSVMMKGLGIAVLGECASGICRDCGETSVAGGVETCTRISILLVSLPLLKELISIAGEMAVD